MPLLYADACFVGVAVDSTSAGVVVVAEVCRLEHDGMRKCASNSNRTGFTNYHHNGDDQRNGRLISDVFALAVACL